jgi:hypothetical protein
MESIKANLPLSNGSVSQQSFNKINPKDGFEVSVNINDLDSRTHKDPGDGRPWIFDGVVFPNGTEFRASYKGYYYNGKVNHGALMMNGKEFFSPCAAAMTITRSDVDGWLFWDCKLPGASSWVDIHSLRQIK